MAALLFASKVTGREEVYLVTVMTLKFLVEESKGIKGFRRIRTYGL